MYDIELRKATGDLLPADTRRAGRSVSRLQSSSVVRQVAVDVEIDVQLAKIDAITSATGQGMAAVTRVAQAQAALEQMAPQASGRLNLLADKHALDVAEVLDDLHHRLRRR